MKYRILTAFTLLFLLVTGCEKSIATDEDGTSGGDTPTAGISDADKQNALTISQAQEIADGTKVCIKGYLIASTERSIQNAIFSTPFEGTTAIVLAEEPIKGSDYWIDYGDLFPICLTDATKGIRDNYNLVDHPEYWNHMVYIIGTREKYMGVPGLKKVTAIEIGEAYQSEESEEPVTPDNPVTPDDPITPENPDDPIDPVVPDDPVAPSYLTVIQAREQTSMTDVSIVGYIVASASYEISNICYTAPFNSKNAIILADTPYDGKTFEDTQLFSINLPDKKGIKEAFNLKDHPKNQNKKVLVKGKRYYYLGIPGITNDLLESIEFIPQEQ